ncbi:phage tail spike protein [Bacillus paranthracis]|nr:MULTISPECIES: phage tail spike protein [Bacillus cereus group]KFL84606.1 hypothetical protein DJ51_3513 [Bacillus cereus]OUB99738.1 peptidase S74 [Bacillus thuringiensis serovar canadensis]MDR4274878.1 peptidase S74 [Bacillus paranthracis]MEC2087297.1 phage tail spike protein [Bacillus paranthracis]MEC2123914.1 phage tail spike protein [Bacillus paranthracis]
MRTPSGTLHVVDFKKSQIVSAIQPKDYWDDKRHWEIKNNIDTLEFRVFENTDHAATLVQQNLVLKEVRGGRIVPYVITEVEKDSDDKSLVVYASGEWIQLAKAEIIEPQKIESKTLKQCMEIALKGTKWEIGKTEHDGAHSITIDEFTNPLDLLKKIAASFELEIQYRAEVVGSQIVVRYVDMVKKRGRDTRKEVTVGKDLLGIKRIENSQNICTALLGYVKKDNGEFITISEINNGVPYLVDDAAYQRWNEKGKHKFAFYTPQTENEDMSPQRLMTLMKTEMNKLVNTSVSYEVQAQSIGRLFGLAHELINEGDTIRIIDTGFTPKLYLEARAIAGDESFKDPKQDKYMFGDYREIVDQNDELRRLYQKILSSLYDKVPQELFDQLKDKVTEQNQNIIDAKDKADQAQKESQTAKDLAEATVEYMEQNLVDIIEGVKPPTANLRPNKTLWRDISGGKPGILKIWTGTTWEPVVPDTGPLQQSIKDVQKDIKTTKTELNQKVQEAQNQATGQFNEVKESLQSVSRTISDVQNEQGNINKKVTQIEQTSDGFKTSIETLTKKDGEISNKLNTVELTVEGTKQTISDIQSDTESLKKTTTEIKTEAGKISEKLASLETREVNVRNYVINSNFSNDKNGWTGITNAVTTKIVDVTVPNVPEIKKGLQLTSNGAFVTQILQIEPFINKKGVASCYVNVKTVTSTSEYPRLYMRFIYDQNGKDQNYYAIIPQQEVTNGWKRISVKFDTTKYTGTLKEVRVNIATANTTTVDATFTGIMVTFGDLLEAWNLAPEDGVTQGTFQSKTTEIEKSVEGVTTTVSNVKKDQDTMQSTLNQVKQTADSNSQTITTISQTQGKHGEIIQQNTTDISQLNNQIKSKVSDTQMQEYVGGLGSTNLLFNTAFEDRVINASTGVITSRTPSVAKWGIWANGTNFKATPESARNHDGYNSVKLETTGLAANAPASLYQNAPSQSNSGDYVFSAWFYTDSKELLDGGAYIQIAYYNGGTLVTNNAVQLVPVLANNSWVFVSATLPAPAAAHNTVRGVVTITRNGRLWMSQPQLQKGKIPSTFMENPKDYANYDQLVGELAKKVATSDFNSKVTQMETTINQQSNRIDLKAEKNDVYNKVDSDGRYGSKAIVDSHTSQLSVMSDEINLRVKNNEISSTINQTAQSVLIQASKIYLDGYIEAKHLKAQTLQGVTIQTAPAGSGANHIRLNAQNLTVYGGGRSRGYLGFIERTDGNIQSALILGNDYETTGTLNGSLVIDQTTINSNVFTNSVASIGIATGRNGNDVVKSSYINFYRYDGAMQINSIGDMSLTNTNGNISLTASSTGGTTGFITLSSSKDINFTAKRGYFNFYTSDNKSFPAMTIKDLAPTAQGDVDFTFANQLMFRVARHPDYVGDGLQIKNGTGTSWANMKVGILRTMGNIGCDADVYAKNFINTSTRKVKTNIEDLPFSALKKVNSVRIKQYNLISDVEKYNAGEIDVLPVNYGMIAEDTDEVFTTREKDAVSLYGSVSITMQAVQELDWKTDNMQCDMGLLKQELEAEKLEKVYIENQLSELKVLVNSQEDRIAKLEELLLQQLINENPEQP